MSCHSQRIFLTVLMFTAAACGGNEPADGAAAALPPTDVQTVTLEPKPVPQVLRIRGDDPVAALDHRSAAGRGLRAADLREGRRPRARGPAARADRSGPPAGDGDDHRVAACRARGRPRARQAAARLGCGSCSRPAPSAVASSTQAEAAHKNAAGAARRPCSRRSARTRCSCEYYRVTAPTSGVIGEIPVRPGDRVTPATAITTIDQPEGLEAYINVPLERATESESRASPWSCSTPTATSSPRIRSPSSRRAPTTPRSRCWSRRRCAACRQDCA